MPTGRIETYENSLVTLVNTYFDDTDLFLYEDDYIKLDLYVYSKAKMKLILDTLKFKDRGQAVDYPGVFPEKDTFTDGDVYVKYNQLDRIAFSKKYNAIIMYTQQKHHISISDEFVVGLSSLEAIMKKVEIVDIVPEKKSEAQVETVTESEDDESNSKNSEDESSTSTKAEIVSDEENSSEE